MPLRAYYPLDENSGSTANDIVANNDASISSSGVTLGSTGILGTTCYRFDGSNGYAIDGDFPVVEFAGVSYSLWVNFDSLSSTQRMVACNEDSSWGLDYVAYENADNVFQVQIGDGSGSGGSVVQSNLSPSTGTWYHVVAVGDATASRLEVWVNGELEGENNSHTTRGNPAPSFAIGRNQDSDNTYTDGFIDDVRIYDHALTPAEVQYLYSASQRGDYLSSIKTQ